MTLRLGHIMRAGPTPVAIHDDRHVSRQALHGVRRGVLTRSRSHRRGGHLDLEDLLFLGRADPVDLVGPLVGRLLDRLELAVRLVRADVAGLLTLADRIDLVATMVANLDLGLFHTLVDLLDQILAALLGQGWDVEPHHRSIHVGRDPDVALLDGLLDGAEHSPVPGLDDHGRGFRHADAGELVQRRERAVVVDLVARRGRSRHGRYGYG